jgi:uncharacterized membrane protein YidH (DUF202 family)
MNTTYPSAQPPSLTPYLGLFAVSFAGIAAMFAIIVAALQIENGAMGLIALMLSVTAPVTKFVKDHKRLMTTSERLKFAGFGTLLALLVTAVLVCTFQLALVGVDGMSKNAAAVMRSIGTQVWIIPLILGGACLIHFGILYFATGNFGRRAIAQQAKMTAGR